MSNVFVQTVWTVLAFGFFIGIVVWAWSGARKKDFEEASKLPLDDDDITIDTHKQENGNV